MNMLDLRERKNITVNSMVRIETSKDEKKSNIVFGKIKKVLDDEEYEPEAAKSVLKATLKDLDRRLG